MYTSYLIASILERNFLYILISKYIFIFTFLVILVLWTLKSLNLHRYYGK